MRMRRLLPALAMPALLLSLGACGGETGLSPIFPTPVSPNGQNIYTLYQLIAIPAILIFLLVEVLLAIIIFRYRRSHLPLDYVPPQTHGNTVLEITWTIIPLIIVLAIAGLSFRELLIDFAPSAYASKDMTIDVSGYQFGWKYTYEDLQGGDGKPLEVNQPGVTQGDPVPLVVPVGKLVRLNIHSENVVHSWWVPAISGKTDAVPGYANSTYLKIDRPGKWRGECAELCGAGHYTMQIEVQAMNQSDFDAWVQKQVQETKPKPASPARTASPKPSPSASP